MKISNTFKARLKLHSKPAYRVAQAVSVDPHWLSKAIHEAVTIKENDKRILLIGKELGLRPEEIFVCEENNEVNQSGCPQNEKNMGVE